MPGEMSGNRGGGGGGATAGSMAAAPPSIPSNARKLVHSLKEVVTGFGDDEIYAMLKDCNMDPNETAQRLMAQDTFHEVKRKRDKKKEAAASNKEVLDTRSRGTGAYRGGRGGGRGGSMTRYTSSDSNGRGKALPPKENGHHAPGVAPAPSVMDSKPLPQQPSYSGSSVSAGGAPALSNGAVYPTTVPATQGSWSKMAGHATMADMLKSSNNKSQHHPPANVLTGQQFSYSSSDPVHHPFADQRSSANVNAKIGIVGNQRPIGDRTAAAGGLPSPSQPLDDPGQPVSPSQEPAKSQEAVAVVSSSETLLQTSGYRAAALGNGRPSYQQQQAATVNKTAGTNLEWKPKLVTQEAPGLSSAAAEAFKSATSPSISESEVLAVAAKFQNLSPREEQQQVIMPNNFQAQGDLGLSFGSFGESLGSSLPSGFSSEDGLDISASSETSVQAKDILHEQSSSPVDAVAQEDSVHHPDDIPAAQRDNLSSNSTPSIPVSYTSQTDMSKLRTAQQTQQQYSSYLPSPPSYSSGISQIPSSQHVFESQESHLQDISTASTSLKQQYADSGASFYSPSPSYRPGTDGDARYAQYLPATGKYANGPLAMTGQQHLPVHEVTNSTTLSSTSSVSASQAPQAGSTHSMPTAAQQPVQVHAYPAQPTGVPVGHYGNMFGYQYPGYTFMPSPYQHSYTTSYPQPPVSSYSPSNYTPAGVAALKYTLPQYKPGSATANAPISGGSYGGYGTAASSMYAANPTPTATNTPGYEDAGGAYKDSNLYMHGPQQGDGARLWQLSNDVTAQPSSFYALSGQSQHTSYTQPSSHTHPMAGYTSLYHHPSQPGPAGSAHQMIQQPQTLSGAAGSTQVGATNYHQQLQQQRNWTGY